MGALKQKSNFNSQLSEATLLQKQLTLEITSLATNKDLDVVKVTETNNQFLNRLAKQKSMPDFNDGRTGL